MGPMTKEVKSCGSRVPAPVMSLGGKLAGMAGLVGWRHKTLAARVGAGLRSWGGEGTRGGARDPQAKIEARDKAVWQDAGSPGECLSRRRER